MLTQTLVSTRVAEHLTRTLFARLCECVDIPRIYREVKEFNAHHKFIKRGVAFNPLKNSVNFEDNFMNQASALVHIYRDGSVAVSHSGIEMGQSLHTKMAMVAAEALDSLHWSEVLGTLAGDNTILMIIRSNEEVPVIITRIQELMK